MEDSVLDLRSPKVQQVAAPPTSIFSTLGVVNTRNLFFGRSSCLVNITRRVEDQMILHQFLSLRLYHPVMNS